MDTDGFDKHSFDKHGFDKHDCDEHGEEGAKADTEADMEEMTVEKKDMVTEVFDIFSTPRGDEERRGVQRETEGSKRKRQPEVTT